MTRQTEEQRRREAEAKRHRETEERRQQEHDELLEVLRGVEAALDSLGARVKTALEPSPQRLPPVPRDPTRRYDALGRQQPRQIPLIVFLRAVPSFVTRFRKVPFQAIDFEGQAEAKVSCPCGQFPLVEDHGFTDAGMTRCGGCERFYVREGQAVWVVYGDMPVPAAALAPVRDGESLDSGS